MKKLKTVEFTGEKTIRLDCLHIARETKKAVTVKCSPHFQLQQKVIPPRPSVDEPRICVHRRSRVPDGGQSGRGYADQTLAVTAWVH